MTVNSWLPGSIELFTPEFFKAPKDLPPGAVHEVRDTIRLLEGMPVGRWELAVGVVGPDESQPVIQLGIQGREPSGWYPVSTIQVVD